MNGDQHESGGLRERIAGGAEDRLGKALTDLLDSPVISGAIGRAFDAREKAAQAQELAMGALNLPSAADMERLTRRLRSLSQRLEGIEDSLERLDRGTSQRLASIDSRLQAIAAKVEELASRPAAPSGGARKPRRAAPARSPAAKGGKARSTTSRS